MICNFFANNTNTRQRKPSLSGLDLNVVLDGDSLTAGNKWASKLYDILQPITKSCAVTEYGVSGQTTQQMLADVNTQIIPLIQANKTNIIIAWEDVNAIYGMNRTYEQNRDDMIEYFSRCINAGFDYGILVTTYNVRKVNGAYTFASYSEYKNSVCDTYYNNMPNVEGLWNVVVTMKNNSDLGGIMGQDANEHFYDSIHLNASGYQIVANYIYEKGFLEIFET